MNVELIREYRFEAAHWLPAVPAGHKCARLHGHSYIIALTLRGEVDAATGWLIDFGVIDERVTPILARLDHRCLNEIPGLANPTSELLADWLWRELHPSLPSLAALSVAETPDARCIFRGQ